MKMMEKAPRRKAQAAPPLVALLVLSCLVLLPLVSSVPLSRSMSLSNHQASVSGLEASVDQPLDGFIMAGRAVRVAPTDNAFFQKEKRSSSASRPFVQRTFSVVAAAEERNLDEVAATARMVIEVNDYPGSGANNRHDPKSPGRA
uniref:Uncharacterized protein n=1 Tax=Oryza brachyantha TaxID=4533 RepID=J3L573_ORYBR